jgi:hypothetical protein
MARIDGARVCKNQYARKYFFVKLAKNKMKHLSFMGGGGGGGGGHPPVFENKIKSSPPI